MDLEDEVAPPVFAKRRFKPINRKTKTQVVFDEKARREFLTGFRKRKLGRKKKAQEELKQQLKEEKRRIKQESKEQYKKLVKTYQPIPELEEKLATYHEVKNATVSILELDADLLAEKNFIIGRNRVNYDDEKSNKGDNKTKQNKKSEKEPDIFGNSEIKEEEESDEQEEEEIEKELKTKKEIKKEIKKKATKLVKKSAAFKKLNKQEQIRQRKKSMKKKTIKMKKLEKANKKKNKSRFSAHD